MSYAELQYYANCVLEVENTTASTVTITVSNANGKTWTKTAASGATAKFTLPNRGRYYYGAKTGSTPYGYGYVDFGFGDYKRVSTVSSIDLTTWANGTWSELANMLAAHDAGVINVYDYIKVGDTRKVELSAMSATGVGEAHVAQSVDLVIVGKNVVDVDGGKCHFVWQQKDCLANGTTLEGGYMNSTNTNVNGWRGSARRTWCNNVYYNALPTELRSMTLQSKIKSSTGNSRTTIETTTDKIFLPCEYNVFGTTSYSVAGEDTVQWDWYKTNANRVKKAGSTGSAYAWWERSPGAGSSYRFCLVSGGGNASSDNADAARGLAPCGCI